MTASSPARARDAFSLVEVVLAMGITSFALVAMLGLFTTGLKSSSESENQIQAANLASMLLSVRSVSPTKVINNFALPPLNVAYGKAYGNGTILTNFVASSGYLTNAAGAEFNISCQMGTNAVTGINMAQVYIQLTWPPRADPSKTQVGRYELTTFIPLF